MTKNVRNSYHEWLSKRPKSRKCAWCKKRIKIKPRGRVPVFCSSSCRQHAYEKRKWQRPHALELLAYDLAHTKVREEIRRQILSVLQEMGLPVEAVPPSRKLKSSPIHLRVVENETSSESDPKDR